MNTLANKNNVTQGSLKNDLLLSNFQKMLLSGSAEELSHLMSSIVVRNWRNLKDERDHALGFSIGLIRPLTAILVHLRDKENLALDIPCFRHYLALNELIALSQRQDIPVTLIGKLKDYLFNVPFYIHEDAVAGNLAQKVYEVHEWNLANINSALNTLGENA
jgi:hypothetical protein